jgi:hypothetical protein
MTQVNPSVARSLHNICGKALIEAESCNVMRSTEEFTNGELLTSCHSCKRSASGILPEAQKDSGHPPEAETE